MLDAARSAGMLERRDCEGAAADFTSLEFISEPEAAAVATFNDMEGRGDIKESETSTTVQKKTNI
jgi:hypothetical protein